MTGAPATSSPTARQQTAEATDSSTQAITGDSVTSFTVTAATPAVDVTIRAGVAIGTGWHRLRMSRRQRASVQTAPIARTTTGNRRLNRNGRDGPVTSSAIVTATAAAVARTRSRDRLAAVKRLGDPESTPLHVPAGRPRERDVAICPVHPVIRARAGTGSGGG